MFFSTFSRTTRATGSERNEIVGDRAEVSVKLVQKQDVAVPADDSVTVVVFDSIAACAVHLGVL